MKQTVNTSIEKDMKAENTKMDEKDSSIAASPQKLIPNILTLMALTAGLSAIQFSIDAKWDLAAIAIVIAAVLDMLDGATARLLNATSKFGAQLDSFSDFLAFGVAPSITLYLWVLQESGKIGWIAMVVFAVASAMRLARYNITEMPKTGAWGKGFFAGVPAPGGAGIALLPLFIWLLAPDFFEGFAFANFAVGFWVIFCAAMMVSRIPTWSSKQIKVPAKMTMPMLALAALLIAAVIQAPWITLTIMGITYLISIPFAVLRFRKIVKDSKEEFDLKNLALGITDDD